MTSTFDSYQTRAVRFLTLWESDGWKVKLYGISSLAEAPEPRLIELAKGIASRTLPAPATDESRYGVAFVTVHQALLFNQIIVDWWERINELRHRVFKAESQTPYSFEEITSSGEAFCTWELRVIGFERDAWVQLVLKRRDFPGINDYLDCRLNEDA